MTTSMTRNQARSLIETHPRRTLVVRFVKRTDGRLRRMSCVYYPAEAECATYGFDPVRKGLLPVWDMEKGAERFVNLDRVESVKLGGMPLTPPPIDYDAAAREMEDLFY